MALTLGESISLTFDLSVIALGVRRVYFLGGFRQLFVCGVGGARRAGDRALSAAGRGRREAVIGAQVVTTSLSSLK